MERAQSPPARVVIGGQVSSLARALSSSGATSGEPVTLYAISWERRLELRGGIAVVPFPTEAILPGWVRSDFPRTSEAIGAWAAKSAEPSALLSYADLGGAGLGSTEWRQWGVKIPVAAPPVAAPFLTRQDFIYRPGLTQLSLGESRAPRPHRVRFFVRRPWTGRATCAAAKAYPEFQKQNLRQQSQWLSALTGWPIAFVLSKSGIFPLKSDVPVRPWP